MIPTPPTPGDQDEHLGQHQRPLVDPPVDPMDRSRFPAEP